MRKILVFSICFVLASSGWGYEFHAGEVSRVGSIPQDSQQTDPNGNVMAVLSVETDIPDLQFAPSLAGLYGIERTEKGYNLLLPRHTSWIMLRAPGFKAYRWNLEYKKGTLQSAVHYYGRVERMGLAPYTGPIPDLNIEGKFEYNMWDLAVRFSKDKRPMLKINTDLPFAFLKKDLLQQGAYEAQETNMAPYELRMPEGTVLRDIVRKDMLRGDIAWETRLESPNVYKLDLTWTDKRYGKALARDLQEAIKENTAHK